MITGAHMILYSKDPDADRAFFKEVLNFPHVDAGRGWLIFALPPSEVAVHPAEGTGRHEIYLMCDDVISTMKSLRERQIECSEVTDQRWGLLTNIKLPGGGELGLYQPKHPVAASV